MDVALRSVMVVTASRVLFSPGIVFSMDLYATVIILVQWVRYHRVFQEIFFLVVVRLATILESAPNMSKLFR